MAQEPLLQRALAKLRQWEPLEVVEEAVLRRDGGAQDQRVDAPSRRTMQREPLLHQLALLGEVSFSQYPRVPGRERAYYLQFKDHIFSAQNGAVSAARCNIAPYPSGNTLSISGVFQPGDLHFLLLLHGPPALSEEEEKIMYCRGDLIVNDMKVGTLAVYRDPEEALLSTVPAPASRVRVKIFVIEVDPQLVSWNVNGSAQVGVAHASFEWDISSDFAISTPSTSIIVPKPAAQHKDLWIMISPSGVDSMLTTKTPLAYFSTSLPLQPSPPQEQPAAASGSSLRYRATATSAVPPRLQVWRAQWPMICDKLAQQLPGGTHIQLQRVLGDEPISRTTEEYFMTLKKRAADPNFADSLLRALRPWHTLEAVRELRLLFDSLHMEKLVY